MIKGPLWPGVEPRARPRGQGEAPAGVWSYDHRAAESGQEAGWLRPQCHLRNGRLLFSGIWIIIGEHILFLFMLISWECCSENCAVLKKIFIVFRGFKTARQSVDPKWCLILRFPCLRGKHTDDPGTRVMVCADWRWAVRLGWYKAKISFSSLWKPGNLAAGKLSWGQSVCPSLVFFLLDIGRACWTLSQFCSCFGSGSCLWVHAAFQPLLCQVWPHTAFQVLFPEQSAVSFCLYCIFLW